MNEQLKDQVDMPGYNTSTTLPDGTVIPAFAYDDGRSVLSVGHLDTEPFLRDAERLFTALGTDFGRLDGDSIIRRHALLRQEPDGSLTVMWNVENSWERVTVLTPGAVQVTLTEV